MCDWDPNECVDVLSLFFLKFFHAKWLTWTTKSCIFFVCFPRVFTVKCWRNESYVVLVHLESFLASFLTPEPTFHKFFSTNFLLHRVDAAQQELLLSCFMQLIISTSLALFALHGNRREINICHFNYKRKKKIKLESKG